VAELFNNLIINLNSKKYQPFLFNLVNGRRHLLNDNEFMLVKSMLQKKDVPFYTDDETTLYHTLILKKQFMTNNIRKLAEDRLKKSSFFFYDEDISNDLSFSVDITRNCNMSCSFCYVKDIPNDNITMTPAHVDSIYNFYASFVNENIIHDTTHTIRLTGGEILFNKESANLIKYFTKKWPLAKLDLFTNGQNIIKYYDKLPLDRIETVSVSLDGLENTHMSQRTPHTNNHNTIYNDIIQGIKRLLSDDVKVRVTTVLNKNTYNDYNSFVEFLKESGISDSPNFYGNVGITFDFSTVEELCFNSNNVEDVIVIQEFLSKHHDINQSLFMSTSYLYEQLARPRNKMMEYKKQLCAEKYLSKYHFSSNGKIYLCDCAHENKGVIGTYHPKHDIKSSDLSDFHKRNIMDSTECAECKYKFVCLGGCYISASFKNKKTTCGVFANEYVMDNLEFNYHSIP